MKDVPIDVIKAGQWVEIKAIRSRLLRDSDFTQVADTPISDKKKAGFALYRSKLRNIPQTYNDPLDVVWPLKP